MTKGSNRPTSAKVRLAGASMLPLALTLAAGPAHGQASVPAQAPAASEPPVAAQGERPATGDQPLAGQQPATGEDIIVTGSYITGTAKDTAVPVSVISQAQIEQRGSPSVLDLIKTLPVIGPVLGDTNQFNAAANVRNGGGTINIRSLGAQRTLVLLNGRRFAGGTADTNLLPIAAIGRIEVLKDGAAATYGSDAIAGVANFITRTNVDGFEAAADYRLVPGSEGGDYTGSLLFGLNRGAFNLLLAGAYQHRAALSVLERDWVVQPYLSNPTGWSGSGNPGAYTPRGGPNGTGANFGYTVDSNCNAVGGYLGFAGTQSVCYYNYIPFDNLVENTNQYQLFGESKLEVAEDTTLRLEAHYANTKLPDYRVTSGYLTSNGPAGPGTSYVIPASNPGFNDFLRQTGRADLIGVAQSALTNRFRPIAVSGNPTTDGKGGQILPRQYNELRLVGEVTTKLAPDLSFNVAATYIREHQNQTTPDILIDRLQRALNGLGGPHCTGNTPGANGCQYFNPFSNAYFGNRPLELTNPGYVPANANSTELVASLFDGNQYIGTQETFVADGVLSGKLPVELPGGAIGFAVGGQYRHIDFRQRLGSLFADATVTPCPVSGQTNCAFRTGPYIFLGQNIPLQLTQEIWAVFGELNVPVTDRLNAQLALRHESYNGLTGSTTNPQFRGRWQVLDALAIRGSVGTSFRGPTPLNSAITGTTLLQGISAAGNQFKSIDAFGNPAVGPENAFTYSVGAILKAGGLIATVDYWSYKVKDQITTVPANVIASAVAGVGNGGQLVNCASPLRPLITFNNNNACTQGVTVGNDIERVRADTTNGPTIKVNGIDFDLNYRVEGVLGGTLDFGGTGSVIFDFKQAAFIYNDQLVSPAYNAAGFANYDRLPGTVSELRAATYADLDTGPHHLNWTMTFVGGVDDNRGPTVVQTGPSANCTVANARAGSAVNCNLNTFGLRVDDFFMHDFTYRLELPGDIIVTASLLNAFNARPPFARLELSYDPFIGNPIGRTYKIGVRKRF